MPSVVKRQVGCPAEDYICSSRKDYEETKMFECLDNNFCPKGYMCCWDSCFQHKICREGTDDIITSLIPRCKYKISCRLSC
jgi:hypothetical protein